MMAIINSRPPNFYDITKVFRRAGDPGVIFAYAPDIYTPSGKPIPPSLIAHEEVHIARQLEMGVKEWWARYFIDMQFRYNEELLAHRAEYKVLVGAEANRQMRRIGLKMVAKRLQSPLYGGLVTLERAMRDITS